MAILLASNVGGTLNITGAITANASPILDLVTSVITGLANNLTAQVVIGMTTVATNVLTCTFNEAGKYLVEGMLYVASNAGANIANAGLNVSFGGSAAISSIKYALVGKANGAVITSNLIRVNSQTTIIALGTQLSSSLSANDYFIVSGYINVGIGTVNVTFQTPNTLNCSANVMGNSYITYQKLG